MTLEQVQLYFGRTLRSNGERKTTAHHVHGAVAPAVRWAQARLHEQVVLRSYGCALIAPEAIRGAHILDLGCGAGHDAFVLAKLVGPAGSVTGVDATRELLAIAREHEAGHAERFGFKRPNTRFLQADIEALDGVFDLASFDLIICNGTLNLCTDKRGILAHARRLLKPGGELMLADLFTDQRMDADLGANPTAFSEGIAGALYWRDFITIARSAGFAAPRLAADRPVAITDDDIGFLVDGARFFAATWRLFNVEGLEPTEENYDQAAIYQGTIKDYPHAFRLDKRTVMETGRPMPVSSNTFRMLKDSRLAPHFKFLGDALRHHGAFPEPHAHEIPFDTRVEPHDHHDAASASCACCA